MKKFLNEFRDFALKSNVMSMAVGLLIGLALQGVVSSLVDDILSPIIGLFIGQNFDLLEWQVMGVTLRYGSFITSIINFIIIAFVVFIMVRFVNKLQGVYKKNEGEATVPERLCPFCKTAVHQEAVRCPSCTSELIEEN